jgi:hypothetical protein
MQGISWVAEELLVSQEGLYSTEYFYLFNDTLSFECVMQQFIDMNSIGYDAKGNGRGLFYLLL